MKSTATQVAVHRPLFASPTLGALRLCVDDFCAVVLQYNAGIFGVSATSPPNVVTGLAVFCGGLVVLLAGMWEFETGNTFAATTFSSCGAFRLSYAVTLIPWFGVYEAYEGHEEDILSANAILLLAWTVFSSMMWVATLTMRANVALRTMFAFLTITFALLTISEFKAGSPAGYPLKRVTSSAYHCDYCMVHGPCWNFDT